MFFDGFKSPALWLNFKRWAGGGSAWVDAGRLMANCVRSAATKGTKPACAGWKWRIGG
jgi:hypothetical protein